MPVISQQIFRHGERNIVNPHPSDPYKDEENWPEGLGQLTVEGKRQLFRLGEYLRRRYSQSLLGPNYSPKRIYIQSTDFDRTIMSAQCCLAGLYPPTTDEKWHNEILWQPIPVHTIPWNMDHVLTTGKHCPKYEDELLKFIKNDAEINRIRTEYADLFVHWSQECGREISSISDVFQLYNTLATEKEHNKK